MSRCDADSVMMVVNQRRKELIAEGDQARLLKAALAEQPCQRWTSRAVSWLGAQMMEWGSRLQRIAPSAVAHITSR